MSESTVRSAGRSPIPGAKTGSNPLAFASGVDRSHAPFWERLGQLVMLALLIVGLPMAYQRAIDNGPDLAGFCDAGRYILEHGTRDPDSSLSRYWPSADVPWIVFARLPIGVVAVLWYGVGCAAWLGLLRTICARMLVGSDPALRRHATLAAGLLAMPLVIDGMCLGSFHVLMVWLMILGIDRACRGRETSGGILLGTAAWLKLLPLLGIGFLVYQRKWKGALTAAVTVCVLEVSLSLAAFGPAGAWREHVVWWQHGAAGTANRQLSQAKASDEDRLTNQSVAVTLRRLLTTFGNGAPVKSETAKSETGKSDAVKSSEGQAGPAAATNTEQLKVRRRVQLANLTSNQLQAVFLATMAILALGVAVYCRPVSRAGADLIAPGHLSAWAEQGPAKIAMLTLATLWFSPVVWSYHYVAAAPVLAILFQRARYRWQWVAPILLVWAGALALLASDTARTAGVLLWMSLLLGAGLVVFPAEADTRRVGRA